MFQVTDLKQFDYCPRLIYYHGCLPNIRPTTAKMALGHEAQNQEEARAARRSLRRYKLDTGEYETNLYLASDKLGLRGRVDMVIKTNDNPTKTWELIPVDYKLSRREAGAHFKMQLLAYALLLEEHYNLPVQRGFLYAIPKRRATEVKFTTRLRNRLTKSLATMTDLVQREQMPEPTSQRAKCITCEFRRFCNDVV